MDKQDNMSEPIWTVIKLGGTSQCPTGYNNLIDIIKKKAENEKIVIVLSALSGTTNMLEKFIHSLQKHIYLNNDDVNIDNKLTDAIIEEIIKKHLSFVKELGLESLSKHFNKIIENFSQFVYEDIYQKDNLMSLENNIYIQSKVIGFGERLSTHILMDYLTKNLNTKIKLLNSYDFIKSKKETFKLYPQSEFYCDYDNLIVNVLADCDIYIAQGFIASTPSDNTILLGRGGSDTTGALISNALNASKYIVYTDVDGIYTTDPKLCKSAHVIKEIDYQLVQELAAMGAKVMHPSSILPCMEKNIPIYIKNTFNNKPEAYTIIKHNKSTPTSAIALQKDIKLIKITSENMWNNYGFVFDIFRRFSERRIDVNIISTSQFTISTTIEEKNKILIKDLIQDLEEKYTVELIENCSIVSIVTNTIPEIYKHIDFSIIDHHLLSIGATNNSISFVIDNTNISDTIDKLHKIITK